MAEFTGYPATATTAWHELSFAVQIPQAINRRIRFHNNVGAGHASLLTEPVVGDSAQNHTLIADWQAEIETLCIGAVATYYWDGATHTAVGADYDWTGETEIQTWNFSGHSGSNPSLVEAILGNTTSWTRKYPKEFTNLVSSTHYTDGTTAIANGDRARLQGNGRIYDRVAGAWVINLTDHNPDLIEKEGQAQSGDVIGTWIFNEMYEALQVLTAKLRTPGASFAWAPDGGDVKAYTTAGFGTEAGAKADADANFAGSGVTTAATTPAASKATFNSGGGGGSDWSAEVKAQTGYLEISSLQDQYASEVDFYFTPETTTLGGSNEWSDQAATLVQDKLNLFDAETKAQATTSLASTAFGDNNLPPDWPAASPGGGNSVARGYQTKTSGHRAVERATFP